MPGMAYLKLKQSLVTKGNKIKGSEGAKKGDAWAKERNSICPGYVGSGIGKSGRDEENMLMVVVNDWQRR
jgi:hypothetical protein